MRTRPRVVRVLLAGYIHRSLCNGALWPWRVVVNRASKIRIFGGLRVVFSRFYSKFSSHVIPAFLPMSSPHCAQQPCHAFRFSFSNRNNPNYAETFRIFRIRSVRVFFRLSPAAMSCQLGYVREWASMAASSFPYKATSLSPSAGISAVDGGACRDIKDRRNLRKWRD